MPAIWRYDVAVLVIYTATSGSVRWMGSHLRIAVIGIPDSPLTVLTLRNSCFVVCVWGHSVCGYMVGFLSIHPVFCLS